MGGTFYSLVQRTPSTKKPLVYRLILSLYPPFLGAGIRVTRVAEDLRAFDVEMRLRPWNRNLVGTHFGGSLYAMCDPFFMLIVIEGMGRDYLVWDKAATIRFRKPGRGTVRASFHVPDSVLESLRRELAEKEKTEVTFRTDVLSAEGEVVAEVEKVIYLRRKRPDQSPASGKSQ